MIKRIVTACVIALGLTGFGLVGSATAHPDHVCKVRMIEWGVNAPGTDTPAKANYEFKRLHNPGPAINVEGWWVQDSYPHVFKLTADNVSYTKISADSPFRQEAGVAGPEGDNLVMPAGSNVYVYNGTGVDGNQTNNTLALYANLGHHHNNAGDTLSFRESDGTAVDWVAYTPYRTRHLC